MRRSKLERLSKDVFVHKNEVYYACIKAGACVLDSGNFICHMGIIRKMACSQMSRQNNTKNKLGIYNNQIVKYITVHESNLINYLNNTVMERVNQ